jgi:hypothetical protein
MGNRVIVLSTCLVLAWAGLATADLVVTVDEGGIGTANGSPMPGGPLTDPTTGNLAFGYLLPPTTDPVVLGDLALTEPGQTSTLSDLIRFAQLPGSTFTGLFFYSDPEDSIEARAGADLGLPANRQTNFLTMSEVGLEDSNGFVYVPAPGNPGYAGPGTVYTITSDFPLPEPASAVLLTCGVVALGFARWATVKGRPFRIRLERRADSH